jgi:hypothetical protein
MMEIKVPKLYGITKKVALFTNARDEKHIREWAAHHLLIGFDNIIIFDHNSIIPLSNIFQNFDKRVTIINHKTSPTENAVKMPLMNKAIQIARKINVDWFIYLDADEFIILNSKYRGIKHLLNNHNFAHSLAINWLVFGSNNLVKDPDGLILGNYTKSDLILNNHVKTFVRPFEAINSGSPHFYNIRDKNRMFALNKFLDGSEPYYFNTNNVEYYNVPAFIAHYINQSEETYIKRKINLPQDDIGKYRNCSINDIHQSHNDYENLYPKYKYAKTVKDFLAQYSTNY